MIKYLKYLRSLELIDYAYRLTGKSLPSINPKLEKLPQNIIFVCTGNICRSAYAQKKFSHLCANPLLTITSAGLDTEDGKQADSQAIEIAAKRKINLSAHRTQVATDKRLSEADLILVMDSSHYKKLKPQQKSKTKFLGCYTNNDRISIRDPFGKSDEVFEKCFDFIDKALSGLKSELSMHTNFRIEDSKVDTMVLD